LLYLDDYTSTETIEKMYKMVENLLKVNAAMNLTAITDWNDIIVKHLADSCTVLPYLPQNS
jgi:16S rRNA (guanine527-N7)-methyltransferase